MLESYNKNFNHKAQKNLKKKEWETKEWETTTDKKQDNETHFHEEEKIKRKEKNKNLSSFERNYNKTRLIIKNIPKYMNERDLKKHFFQMKKDKNFQITDIKIMKKKKIIDNEEQYISRNICFIGFLNEIDCENFKNFFNNTYINQCKIIVENAFDPIVTSHNANSYQQKYTLRNDEDNDKKWAQQTIVKKEGNVISETIPVKTTKAGMSNTRTHVIFLDEDDSIKEEKTEKKTKNENEKKNEENNGTDSQENNNAESQETDIEQEDNALSWLRKVSKKNNLKEENKLKQKKEQEKEQGKEQWEEQEEKQTEEQIKEQIKEQMEKQMEKQMDDNQNRKDNESVTKELFSNANDEEENMNSGKIFIFNLPPVSEEDVKLLCEKYGPVVDIKIFRNEKGRNLAIDACQDKINKSNETFFINLLKESDPKLKGKKDKRKEEKKKIQMKESDETQKKDYTETAYSDLTYIKAYAFVSFMFPSNCEKAKKNLNNTIYKGKVITVKYAKEKIKYIQNTEKKNNKLFIKLSHDAKSSYQKIKEIQKKRTSQNENIWNILYTDINASIHNFCKETNCSREDVLNIRDKNIATNVALTETYIISKMKDWLKQEGIFLDAFEHIYIKKDIQDKRESTENGDKKEENKNEEERTILKYKRSDDTIIIKNLSMATNKNDIINLFKKYGVLKKTSFSPYNNMAIIQFEKSENAKNAFIANSYLRYKSLPLYLEWAPINLYASTEKKEEKKEEETKDKTEEGQEGEEENGNKGMDTEREKRQNNEENEKSMITKENIFPLQSEDESSDEETTHASVFIKNINFKTTEESLRKLFENMEGFLTCNIVKSKKAVEKAEYEKNKNEKPQYVSLGYGFAEFKNKENAKEAMKKLTAVNLDDRVLEMSLSHNRIKKKKEKNEAEIKEKIIDKKKISKKLVVKNLAFQANKQELRNLFTPFGNVKSVRIPKNAYNRSRGYAFIEFMSKKECLCAMEALSRVHFYGRPLVLDFANDFIFEENIDEYEKLKEESINKDNVGKHVISSEQAKRKAVYEAQKLKQQTESKKRKMLTTIEDI